MALEPSLWGTLPKELLHLVFAQLPIAGIGQLRVLSREWKKNVNDKDSEFNQVFGTTIHVNMFALFTSKYCNDTLFTTNIYDLQANKWHYPKIDAIFGGITTFIGGNGGLVCFSLNQNWYHKNFGIFIVMNPLTKQKTQLPPLLSMVDAKATLLVEVGPLVELMKFTMDRKTKEYKVFVAGSFGYRHQEYFVQVYDSHIKEWRVVETTQGHIIGWKSFGINLIFNIEIYIYNCANGILKCFNETNIVPGLKVEKGCYEVIEDHLFILHKVASLGPINILEDGVSKLPKYCISEFYLQENTTTWVKLGVCTYVPSKFLCHSPYYIHNLRLSGCNGFLLVHDLFSSSRWLYNLSTCKWCNLPALVEPLYSGMMCEISWSAIA